MSNLIWLRFGTFPLKIDSLHDTSLREYMMAARHAHPESFCFEQAAKLFKADIRIGLPAQELFKCFLNTHVFGDFVSDLQLQIHIRHRAK